MAVLSEQNRGGALRTAVVLALCAVFLILAMGIALMGSGVYRGTVAASNENFTRRTALSYLVNQIRRGDIAGGVAVGSLEGADAVVLTEGAYVTYLYCRDGQLRELYMEAGTGLTAADGVPVLPLDALSVTLEGARITLTVTAGDGTRHSVSVTPRSGVREVVAL